LAVAVQRFNIAGLKADRDQLWAEAAQAEAARESIRLPKELWELAGVEQQERTITEPWVEAVASVLGDHYGKLSCQSAWEIVGVPIDRRT
jgi:predicted P-loop ATPase